jgi:hypothetical protein
MSHFGERPSKKIHQQLVNVDTADADELSKRDIDFDNIRVAMYRTRRHKYACLSGNMLETVNILTDTPLSSIRREDMLCYNETTSNKPFVMFTTRTNLKALCAAETVLMEGTFKSCPQFFS